MPGRVSVKIGDTKFEAIEIVFLMGTQKDAAGMPTLQTLHTKVGVWADLFDDENIPFNTIKEMFTLANVPDRDKVKEMTIEFWNDDRKNNAICAFMFKGWISKLEIYNPVLELNGQPAVKDAAGRVYNHVLHLELSPIINKHNHQEISISN